MPNPVAPSEPRKPRDYDTNFDEPLTPHSDTVQRRPPPPPRDPSELPYDNGMAVAHAVRAHQQQARVAEITPTVTVAHDAAIQQRMDAFRQAAMPTYRLPDGSSVQVATPFRLVPLTRAEPFGSVEARVDANRSALRRIAASVGLGAQIDRMQHGRGTPQEIRRLTQALIDAGRLPATTEAGSEPEKRVRKMMADHGLGLDCAGYVQQAMLAAHQTTRAKAGLRPRLEDEDLSRLSHRGMRSVPVDDVKPGDLVIFRPPSDHDVGHTTIVYDRDQATEGDLRALRDSNPGLVGFARGDVVRIRVDSSFGSRAQFAVGGVRGEMMLHDTGTGHWAWSFHGRIYVGRPFDHDIEGAYRPRDGAAERK